MAESGFEGGMNCFGILGREFDCKACGAWMGASNISIETRQNYVPNCGVEVNVGRIGPIWDLVRRDQWYTII